MARVEAESWLDSGHDGSPLRGQTGEAKEGTKEGRTGTTNRRDENGSAGSGGDSATSTPGCLDQLMLTVVIRIGGRMNVRLDKSQPTAPA